MKAVSLRWKEIKSRSRCNPKEQSLRCETRKSLLFLFCIYQRFRAEYSTGPGKRLQKA